MTDRPLPDHIRAFLDDERFATISTIDPDGAPRQAVIWYTLDGDEFVINSRVGRRWPTQPPARPADLALGHRRARTAYRWVGLTGTVRPITDQRHDPGRHRRDGPPLPRRRPGRGPERSIADVRVAGADQLPVPRRRPSTTTWTTNDDASGSSSGRSRPTGRGSATRPSPPRKPAGTRSGRGTT